MFKTDETVRFGQILSARTLRYGKFNEYIIIIITFFSNVIEGHTRRLFGRRPKRRSSVHTGTFQGTGMRGVWPVVVWRLNVRRIYWKIRKSVLNCMKVVNGPIPGQSLHMRFPGSPPSPPPAHREIVAAGPLLHRISPPTA